MNAEKTNEQDLMRGALIPTFAVGIIGIIVDGISGASINLKPEKISESLVKLPPIKADIMREELSHVH